MRLVSISGNRSTFFGVLLKEADSVGSERHQAPMVVCNALRNRSNE